ncbi:T9SS type A sorting domain-containing protein [Epilithonimonas hungarica]|uniref:Por secretion system C-terminal sorting domain-containing protein n=1 Tax=Epilithonimonas hungarica TaxID=454006 RepID=A0A1G7MUN4_9FLAO|nr:T9SS type A sorting domain-containing protein [Epilithonimonas hungarica]SDF65548.1 Por secretion system C-terminal sorting domain-containing protein [Epilithonimonas hungarica]
MKKIFTILSIAAVSLVSAQNLVTNPGFETGVLAPWAKGPSTAASYTEPTLANSGSYAGTYNAAYTAATGTTGFYQDIAITGGTEYTVSFWYKATGDGTDARIWSVFKDSAATILYLAGDASTATSDPLRGPNNLYLDPATSWTQKSITFTSPAAATVFQLAVRAYNNSTLAAFDDFSLVQGGLAVTDFSKSKYSLVKNTVVGESIAFAKNADIQIINAAGQVVKAAKVTEGSTLNVSSLVKGTYIVTGTVNGEKVSQKIIKK